ncbi:MAG TPA: RNA polymerase sigma factor, partial [Pyrinomonadaceae bacterium]
MKLITDSAPVSHEDLFIERYARLSVWALQMTGNDKELAEDLVQDAFIQFTFTRPDIAGVHNLEAYLYGLMRNLHLSQVRRSSRARLQPLSIVEYESAEMSLRAADARDQIKAQDELRHICRYACARKESAWVGSVLILRFFHGYYPSEIAQILRTTRSSVDERLRLARSEARASLEQPATLGFIKETATVPFGQTGFAREINEFLVELRQMIFQSRQGHCFSHKQLQALYKTQDSAPMKSGELAHIVSCPTCMDIVNKCLGLPLLAKRYPTDTLGRDQRGKSGKGGKGGDGGEGSGGGASVGAIKRWRRRAREAFEHRPKELHISVNGLLQGSQKVNSELSEQTLDVDMTEQIGFVEVFSELGIRLLLLNVDELPPRGDVERVTRVELSDQRGLELKLRFDSPWPTLHVAYTDPLFITEVQSQKSNVQSLGSSMAVSKGVDNELQRLASNVQRPLDQKRGFWKALYSRIPEIGPWTFDLGLLTRPATVTVLFAIVFAAAFLMLRTRNPVTRVTAADLLRQAAQQEEIAASRTDQVVHRLISLEERKGGELIAQRKIEVWQSAERGITARRLYDERGRLIAGDWRNRDGVQTIYHHGSQARLQIRKAGPPDGQPVRGASPQSAVRNVDDAWQFSPSANDFAALIGSGQTRLNEQGKSYVISSESEQQGSEVRGQRSGLVKATLTLSKVDLHATELTLIIEASDKGQSTNPQSEIRNPKFVEFRFVETSFERRPPEAVAPAVFEPDAVLLGNDTGTRGVGDTENVTASHGLP